MLPDLSQTTRSALLTIARASIEYGFSEGVPMIVREPEMISPLRGLPTFVSIHTPDGNQRGCIGRLVTTLSLPQAVSENAYKAAFHDPRQKPMQAGEMDKLGVVISVLDEPEPLDVDREDRLGELLEPGIHGAILRRGHREGVLLPDTWRYASDPCDFVSMLVKKTGLEHEDWDDGWEAFRFETLSFSEERENN